MRQVKSESNNYDKDFYKWAMTQADLLKHGKFDKVDLENVIEEIEDLGNSKRSALKSHMINLLMHLLKVEYQPNKLTRSWRKTIVNSKIEIDVIVEENPSLKRELKDVLKEAYSHARKKAHLETKLDIKAFPTECPWNLKQVLENE